jgi:hypothetical protein
MAIKKLPSDASIRIGSIWFPVRNLPAALARHTKLVFCLTGSDNHPYSLRGSATGLKFRDRHLLLCCGHQIANIEPHMRPARGLDDLAAFAIRLVKPAEAGIGVGPHQSGIARQMPLRMLTATIRRVEEHGRRRIWPTKPPALSFDGGPSGSFIPSKPYSASAFSGGTDHYLDHYGFAGE